MSSCLGWPNGSRKRASDSCNYFHYSAARVSGSATIRRTRLAGVHPEMVQVTKCIPVFLHSRLEDRVPRSCNSEGESGRDVVAYRVHFIPVHSLLEVDRVGREVPMDHRVAPPLEIDSLLSRGTQSETAVVVPSVS